MVHRSRSWLAANAIAPAGPGRFFGAFVPHMGTGNAPLRLWLFDTAKRRAWLHDTGDFPRYDRRCVARLPDGRILFAGSGRETPVTTHVLDWPWTDADAPGDGRAPRPTAPAGNKRSPAR